MIPIGMYAVKHVNLMETHIPPRKKANQARIVDVVEVFTFLSGDRKAFVDTEETMVEKTGYELCLVVVCVIASR